MFHKSLCDKISSILQYTLATNGNQTKYLIKQRKNLNFIVKFIIINFPWLFSNVLSVSDGASSVLCVVLVRLGNQTGDVHAYCRKPLTRSSNGILLGAASFTMYQGRHRNSKVCI